MCSKGILLISKCCNLSQALQCSLRPCSKTEAYSCSLCCSQTGDTPLFLHQQTEAELGSWVCMLLTLCCCKYSDHLKFPVNSRSLHQSATPVTSLATRTACLHLQGRTRHPLRCLMCPAQALGWTLAAQSLQALLR